MNIINYIENVLVHFQINLKFNKNLRLLKHVVQSQEYVITSFIVLQKNDEKSLNCILLGRTIKHFYLTTTVKRVRFQNDWT